MEKKTNGLADLFRNGKRDGNLVCGKPPDCAEMCERIGESYYFVSRVLSSKPKDDDMALSRTLMIIAARLNYDYAVIQVGHMGDELKIAYDWAN
jgi:hypothetical protein